MNAHQPPGQGGRRWPVPATAGPVRASVALPGSKSMTNRALVLAALADGPVAIVRRPLRSRDTLLMAGALRALGVPASTTVAAPGTWRVGPRPRGGRRPGGRGPRGHGHALRAPGRGAGRRHVLLRRRPAPRTAPGRPILAALRVLGAASTTAARRRPVHRARHRAVPGGSVTIDASASSQFVSGLLLAAPRFDKGVEVRHEGPPVPSAAAHRDDRADAARRGRRGGDRAA